jgi:hypothetical protein
VSRAPVVANDSHFGMRDPDAGSIVYDDAPPPGPSIGTGAHIVGKG